MAEFFDWFLSGSLGLLAGDRFRKVRYFSSIKSTGEAKSTTFVSRRTWMTGGKHRSRVYALKLRWDAMGPLSADANSRNEAGFCEKEFICNVHAYNEYNNKDPGSPGPTIFCMPDKPEDSVLGDFEKSNAMKLFMICFATAVFVNVINFGKHAYLFTGGECTPNDDTDDLCDVDNFYGLPLIVVPFVPIALFCFSFVLGMMGMVPFEKCCNMSLQQKAKWFANGTNPLPEASTTSISMQTLPTGSPSPYNPQAEMTSHTSSPFMGTFACSNCGNNFQAASGQIVACPACGAQMQV